MNKREIRADIHMEFAVGFRARAAGNEGQARVCARRAGGKAAKLYLEERGLDPGKTALDSLRIALEQPGLPEDVHAAAERLLLRVGEDFTLPDDIDLLHEAKVFVDGIQRVVE